MFAPFKEASPVLFSTFAIQRYENFQEIAQESFSSPVRSRPTTPALSLISKAEARTLFACAIGTTFSATAGGKKEVVFLFEDSTVWAMPKPAMTREDVEALTKALQEMHAAEVDVQKAFLEQRPWEERDKAIKKARQTRYAWISLGAKFFTNWPV